MFIWIYQHGRFHVVEVMIRLVHLLRNVEGLQAWSIQFVGSEEQHADISTSTAQSFYLLLSGGPCSAFTATGPDSPSV